MSQTIGIVTSGVEVVQITPFGIWIDVSGKEYFLDYEKYPWFRKAAIGDIWNVQLDQHGNLHWPTLDIDLEIDSLIKLERYRWCIDSKKPHCYCFSN